MYPGKTKWFPECRNVFNMKQVVAIAALFASIHCFSQPNAYFKISTDEKRWAFFHPFAALKLKKHKQEVFLACEAVKKNRSLDQYENGGKLDAFRHVYAMAYFSRFVSVKKLRKLGRLHEKGNYRQFQKNIKEEGELPDSISSVMDLKNNEIGFSLAKEARFMEQEALQKTVIDLINAGKTYSIKRDASGNYIDCEGVVLPPEKIKGTWKNSKCLTGPS